MCLFSVYIPTISSSTGSPVSTHAESVCDGDVSKRKLMHVSLFFYCCIQSLLLASPVNIVPSEHHEDKFSSKYDTKTQ